MAEERTRKSTLDQPRLVSVPDLGAVDEPAPTPSSQHRSHRVSISEHTDLRSISDDEEDAKGVWRREQQEPLEEEQEAEFEEYMAVNVTRKRSW